MNTSRDLSLLYESNEDQPLLEDLNLELAFHCPTTQAILLGGVPAPIPENSSVLCGKDCGVIVPPAPESLPDGFKLNKEDIRWQGDFLSML